MQCSFLTQSNCLLVWCCHHSYGLYRSHSYHICELHGLQKQLPGLWMFEAVNVYLVWCYEQRYIEFIAVRCNYIY